MWVFFGPDFGDFTAHVEKYRELSDLDMVCPVMKHTQVPSVLRVLQKM